MESPETRWAGDSVLVLLCIWAPEGLCMWAAEGLYGPYMAQEGLYEPQKAYVCMPQKAYVYGHQEAYVHIWAHIWGPEGLIWAPEGLYVWAIYGPNMYVRDRCCQHKRLLCTGWVLLDESLLRFEARSSLSEATGRCFIRSPV